MFLPIKTKFMSPETFLSQNFFQNSTVSFPSLWTKNPKKSLYDLSKVITSIIEGSSLTFL